MKTAFVNDRTPPIAPLVLFLDLRFFLRRFGFCLAVVAVVLVSACGQKQTYQFSGQTMGTAYHITVVGGAGFNGQALEKIVSQRLTDIDRAMSTYRSDSEVSRFNAADPDGVCRPFPVSRDLMNVLTVARDVYRLSRGAWDGTVGPLVERWGFGRSRPRAAVPHDGEIKALLTRIGFERIRILGPDRICKTHPGLRLDLASIAKGYGVDQIAAAIREFGVADFLVEIGGEVYAAGSRMDGEPWRVGISWPDRDQPPEALYRAVELTRGAMATSGDYRNFFEVDGVRYAHVLDPRTGYPVQNGVVSASVIADTCTFADALATALMVMGPQQGIALVEQLPHVECLIIVRERDGRLTGFRSDGFP